MIRKILFYIITFGLVLLTLEGAALVFVSIKDKDDVFDHREGVLARLNSRDFTAFLEKTGDPVLGWDHRGPDSGVWETCTGLEVGFTFDALGARTYSGYDASDARIIVVGDSYSNGAEADDNDAYPAHLARILGESVANHAVGGYGPVQSVLSLEQKLHLYPETRAVVLGIMYENIYRMMNSYRAVLYENAFDYGLKPYMKGGEVMPHPGAEAFEDIGSFREFARSAFDNDFWAKPVESFPYSVSLVRGLGSNYFYFRKFQKRFRKLGIPEYFLAFRSEKFSRDLLALLDRFTRFARDNHVTPVAVFIPRNRYDTESAGRFIGENRARLPDDLLVGDVGSADIDWKKFNLESTDDNDICHPSPYGYRKIAEYVASLLQGDGGPPL